MTIQAKLITSLNRETFETCDSLGRRLQLRRINALDRLRLLKAAGPTLSQNDAWLNMAALAVSVVELNGIPRVTPLNEPQIEAAIAELGDQGLQAIAEALNSSEDDASLFEDPPEGNTVGTPILPNVCI